MAAASAGSRNRYSTESCGVSGWDATRRSAPPPSTAGSCRSSPRSRTTAPRAGSDLDEPVEQEGARHSGLVDEHDITGVQPEHPAPVPGRRPLRAGVTRTAPRSTREGTCASSPPVARVLGPEHVARGGQVASGTRRCPESPQDVREGPHRGRLARSGSSPRSRPAAALVSQANAVTSAPLPGIQKRCRSRLRTRPSAAARQGPDSPCAVGVLVARPRSRARTQNGLVIVQSSVKNKVTA